MSKLLKEIDEIPAFREIGWLAKLTLVTGFFKTTNATAASKAIEAATVFCSACEISHEDLCRALCSVVDNSGRGLNFVSYLKALSAAMAAAAPPPAVLIQPKFTTQLQKPQPPVQETAEVSPVENKNLDQLVAPRDRVVSGQLPPTEKPTVVVDMEFPFDDLAEVRRLIEGQMVRAIPRGSVLYTRSQIFDGGNLKVTLEVLNNEPSPVVDIFIVRRGFDENYSGLECAIEPQSVLNDVYNVSLNSQNVVIKIY